MMLLGIFFLALLAPVEPFKLSFKRPVDVMPPPPPPPPPQPEPQPNFDHLGPVLPDPPRPQPIIQQHEEIEQAPIKGSDGARRPIYQEAPRLPALAYVIIRPYQSGLHQPIYSAPLNWPDWPERSHQMHPPPCHPGEDLRFSRYGGPMCYPEGRLSDCSRFPECPSRGTKGQAPIPQWTKGGMPPRDEPQPAPQPPPPPPPPQPEPYPEIDELMAIKQSKLAKLKSHLDKLTAKFSTSYHYAGEELIPLEKPMPMPMPPRPEVQAPFIQAPIWQAQIEQQPHQQGWDEQERDTEQHQQQEQLPDRDLGTKQPQQQLEATKQERPLGLKTQQLDVPKPDLGIKQPQQQIELQKPERETGLKQQQQIELPKQELATKEREHALKERPQQLVAEETRKNGEPRRESSRLASNHVAPPSSSSSLASSGAPPAHPEAGFEASVRRSGA